MAALDRSWKPGDVAVARISKWVGRVFFTGETWTTDDDECEWETDALDEVRQLLVIDAEDAEACDELAEAIERVAYADLGDTPMTMRALRIQAAIRSLTKPPKPEEPTGLGAVIEDSDGVRWTLTMAPEVADGSPWVRDHLPASGIKFARWSELSAVRVLSEGVPA